MVILNQVLQFAADVLEDSISADIYKSFIRSYCLNTKPETASPVVKHKDFTTKYDQWYHI